MKFDDKVRTEDSELTVERIAKLMTIIFIILAGAATTANVDLVNPVQNFTSAEPSTTFEYFLNDFNATTCSLKVDGTVVQTEDNITPGFRTMSTNISLDEHTWQVVCADSNTTEESEQRSIIIDEVGPTLVMLTPQNSATLSSGTINLSFVALDNHAEQIPCTIILNSEPHLIIANNSQPENVQFDNLDDGQYNWSLLCLDNANNTKSSDTWTFAVNTSDDEPIFGMALNGREFYTGDHGTVTLLAPSGSSGRVEICPDINGFVECTTPINILDFSSEPASADLPFMNKEGMYVVDAYFSLNNHTATKTEQYNVTSTIQINVEKPQKPRKSEPVLLEATATGGIGTLNYTWVLSNGSRYDSRKANITYPSPNNYTNTIYVTDTYNNTRNQSIILDVSNSNLITIAVKDEIDGSPIKGATVSIDYQDEETDTDGKASIYVRGGKRDLIILAKNYSIYDEELNISQDQTFAISLKSLNMTKSKPLVTLTAPENNATVIGTSTEVGFSIASKFQCNCSVYIAENGSNFYIYLGSTIIPANDKGEKRFEVIDLENMSYNWKVECIDTQGTSGISESRSLNIGLSKWLTEQNDALGQIDKKVKQLELVQKDIENMPSDLKETVIALGFEKKLDETILQLKNAIRDIDALNYKNLDSQSFNNEKNALMKSTDQAYAESPASFTLIASDSFVDYIEKPDLNTLTKAYISSKYGENSTIDLKKALNFLEALQQEVLISTKVSSITVTYASGSSKDRTIVVRNLKVYNVTADSRIVESIPKSLASSASEIKSSMQFETINNDPIISFALKNGDVITYYFEKRLSKDDIMGIKTAIFSDLDKMGPEYVTGLSITHLSLPDSGWLIPIAIILLASLIFGTVRYEGHKIAQYAIYLTQRNNTLHYVNVILNDINDNLQLGNVQKAVSLYDEAKAAYTDLPGIAKNDIYGKIMETAKAIEEYQNRIVTNDSIRTITLLLNNADRLLSEMQLSSAIQEYKKIEEIYHTMDDGSKQSIQPHIIDMCNKIQVLVNSNKRQKYE
jgi:hypothetical protein